MTITRRCTTLASYAERKSAWKTAITAAEMHIKLGSGLQAQGLEQLRSLSGATSDTAVKLSQQAAATIEKGVKLERDARDQVWFTEPDDNRFRDSRAQK